MGRMLKSVLFFIAAVAALLAIGIIAVAVLFDANDYKEDIERLVRETTGRELVIEGDIGMAVFPWLAIEIGETRLGNGAGFGAEPFASFDEASLSVRLMPMLLHREAQVTTAELVGLHLNLAINSEGRSNWQDFIDASEAMESMPPTDEAEAGPATDGLDISGFDVVNSSISYVDAQAGGDVQLSDLNIRMGSITGSHSAIHLDGFSIEALLEGVAEVPTTFGLETASVDVNTDAETIALDEVELALLGLDISAAVEPFSYAGDITPVAAIKVDAFSLRSLMQRMAIEAPETTDPTALGKVIIDATASVGSTEISLTDLTLVLDDTTFKGRLSIPQGDNDTYTMDLKADNIDLDRYMAPVTEQAAANSSEEVPVEIPAELIRLINARGSLAVDNAHLSGMQFDDVELGLVTNNGNLRLYPISATLFDGKYNGDVRIDASGDIPVLSVNERIEGVQLGALAKAMFEQENISGTINGSFELRGRGADLGAIQRDLDGNIVLELIDGAWEGTDVWYELRRARATFRQEPAPEATLPARTQFSEVSASGPVNNGVFTSNDLIAELPFMRITGNGSANFVEATVDYRMSAEVFDKPEFFGDDVSADEIKDFTKTVIPLRISGPLASPTIAPDFEKLLKDELKKEVEDKIKDKLGDLFKRD
jgi:AsmA protein